MKTVTFLAVLKQVLRMQGITYANATDEQKAQRAEHITRRLVEGWELDFWPEWTLVEERAYRNAYSAATAYVIGDQVWNGTDTYYECIQAGTGQALTNTAYWKELEMTVNERWIALEQTRKTRIGAVKGVYTSEQNAIEEQMELDWTEHASRIYVYDSNAGATVWVKFRKVAPRFSTELWVQGYPDYQEGWVVMWPAGNTQMEGNCYRAGLDPTTGAQNYWELMEIPTVLENYVVAAAFGDALVADGQVTRGTAMQDFARAELNRAHAAVMLQQGLGFSRPQVTVY
jgi:hypothetical protein